MSPLSTSLVSPCPPAHKTNLAIFFIMNLHNLLALLRGKLTVVLRSTSFYELHFFSHHIKVFHCAIKKFNLIANCKHSALIAPSSWAIITCRLKPLHAGMQLKGNLEKLRFVHRRSCKKRLAGYHHFLVWKMKKKLPVVGGRPMKEPFPPLVILRRHQIPHNNIKSFPFARAQCYCSFIRSLCSLFGCCALCCGFRREFLCFG